MESIYILPFQLSLDKAKYELRVQCRGTVDFTIENLRNGVPYGLRIDRSSDPSEAIEFYWMKGEVKKLRYWNYTSTPSERGHGSTSKLHKFFRQIRTFFQENLLPVKIMAEKAIRQLYYLFDSQMDWCEYKALKERLLCNLFGNFYVEDYRNLRKKSIITFLMIEEGLGFLTVDSLVFHTEKQQKVIEEFLHP